MNNITLNNGVKMPVIGLGVYQITDPVQCEKAVYEALMAGYRSIDTAASYMNEEAVGNAVKRSGILRSELFITTKLWVQDTDYESARRAFEKSVDKLKIDYLDLYLIHQPYNDYYGAWRAMEELYKEGRIRAIGVSNFMPDRLVDLIMNNEIVPAVNQVETNPFCQQIESSALMDEYGVQIESWGPFAEGRSNMFQNKTLLNISKTHNKSVAQIILRWLVQRGIVVIPKSVHKDRIIENYNIFDFELGNDEMKSIADLDTNISQFFSHRDPEIVKQLNSYKINI